MLMVINNITEHYAIYSIKIHINSLCSEVWQHLKILTMEEWKLLTAALMCMLQKKCIYYCRNGDYLNYLAELG
jgi:hypothetical protein